MEGTCSKTILTAEDGSPEIIPPADNNALDKNVRMCNALKQAILKKMFELQCVELEKLHEYFAKLPPINRVLEQILEDLEEEGLIISVGLSAKRLTEAGYRKLREEGYF